MTRAILKRKTKEELSELNIEQQHQYFPLFRWNKAKGYKGAVVNRTFPSLHGGSVNYNANTPLKETIHKNTKISEERGNHFGSKYFLE